MSAARYCTFRFGFGAQVVPRQTLGDAQSALLAQVVLHAVAPQANGTQLDDVTVWQVPVPLRARAVAGTVVAAAGGARVGALVQRVGARGDVRARAERAGQRARLAGRRAG